MKTIAFALAAATAITGAAHAADGSLEIYAIIDDSVAHIEHSLPTSDIHTFGFNTYNVAGQDQGSRWAVVSGAEQMSRYGLQGNELFSNGMSAFFKLEGAMNTASGQIANNCRSVLNNANSLTTISSQAFYLCTSLTNIIISSGVTTIGDGAFNYCFSLPGISRHLKVLQRAGLIARSREAQWRPCRLQAAPIKEVADWTEAYRRHWEQSFDRLGEYLAEIQGGKKTTQHHGKGK